MLKRAVDVLMRVISVGVAESCDDDERLTRRAFTAASLFVSVVAPAWAVTYASFGELGPGLIPSAYAVITLASFVALDRFGGWQWFRTSQIVLIFILPFALMLSLGGYGPGSAVMIWAILAPLGALWGGRSRESLYWVAAFVVGAIVSGVAERWLRDTNDLPDVLITVLFVMNVVFLMGVVHLLINFYVRRKDTTIAVMRRNRELEEAYLAQEVSLRESDKLATLGRLSAGMAHELNNPASAAQQATQQLSRLLLADAHFDLELSQLELDESETALARDLAAATATGARHMVLEPLERSDREMAVQGLLERMDVDGAWEIAPSLVSLGLEVDDLARVAGGMRADRFARLATGLDGRYARKSLLGALDESTGRIIELVRALKSYSFLDQAPRQIVDVHDGLESTLLILQNRLKGAIKVELSYAEGLPQIEVYGSELNQVWTNILDNALDALDGEGTIEITTSRHGERVVVEISDNGPGIPSELVGQIFDPFVTTKAPGEGTGLGLNISHNIVTQKHGGDISVASQPGRTTFTVRLPITLSDTSDDDPPKARAVADTHRLRSDPWRSR